MSSLPIKLISTDFDGTLFAEFENPPVPVALQNWIQRLQDAGAKWVINTGRDSSSLLETMARAQLRIKPDFLVVVEREIYVHENHRYTPYGNWNQRCSADHAALFERLRADLPEIIQWIEDHFDATVYEDFYSPFCLIAGSNKDADAIQVYIEEYCKRVPDLTLMRNDVYARFCHSAYNKGTALAELGRHLGIGPESILAAGDHMNDLPMLQRRFAHYLVSPQNAIPSVKEQVKKEGGYISSQLCGHGVVSGLEFWLEKTGSLSLLG